MDSKFLMADFFRTGIAALCFATTVSGLVVTSMFVLAPFIVLAANVTNDRQALGYWSGVVVSAFYVGRMITAPLWGWSGDRFGRLTMLKVSLIATGALTICCSFVSQISSITVLRFVTGCLSAVQAMCHTMAWELGKERGTALIESGWTLASMLGPGLSGFLWQKNLQVGSQVFAPHAIACVTVGIMQLAPLPFLLRQPLENSATQVAQSHDLSGYGATNSRGLHPANLKWNFQMLAALILNGVGVFISSAMDEVSVLFAVGSLGFSEKTVGECFLIAGVFDFILQNLVLVHLVEKSNVEFLRSGALMLWASVLLLPPTLRSLERGYHFRLCALSIAILLRKLCSFLFNVANTSLLNANVDKNGSLGSVHGWRVTVASLMQIGGPLSGATLYAWSATSEPHGEAFVFFCASTAVLAMAIVAVRLSFCVDAQDQLIDVAG